MKKPDRSRYPLWYWVVIANLQTISAVLVLLILKVAVMKYF